MIKKIIFTTLVYKLFLIQKVYGAEKGGMPQLDPQFWFSQIFWLIFTFGFLFLILSKFILPKISNNLETRRSQIKENIETAEKQKKDAEKKIDEYEKIILESHAKAKKYFGDARLKILEDINKKRENLENEINSEIKIVENEINESKKNAPKKINLIAIELSSNLVKQLINDDVNNSSISAIVEDFTKKHKENNYNV